MPLVIIMNVLTITDAHGKSMLIVHTELNNAKSWKPKSLMNSKHDTNWLIARKGKTEAAIKKMEEEWKEMDREILQKTEEAKQSLIRLQEIAPAGHFTKYMDTLIN